MAERRGSGVGRRQFLKLTAVAAAARIASPATASAAEPRPKRGGVLRHVGFEPPTWDIHGSVSYQTQLVSSMVNRTLFKFVNGSKYGPSDFTMVPDLAQKAEVSPDG